MAKRAGQRRQNSSERVFTDLQIERLLCGDLDTSQFERDATYADRERLQVLKAEGEAFLADAGVHKQSVVIVERLKEEGGRERKSALSPWWYLSGLGLAGLAAIVFVVAGPGGLESSKSEPEQVAVAPEPPEEEDLRAKGDDAGRLSIHLATDEGSRKLMANETLPESPRLRFSYAKDARGYLAIVGVDATLAVSLYVSEGDEALAYDPDYRDLSTAIELDDSPGFERFLAFYSAEPFNAAKLVSALRGGIDPQTLAQEARLELVSVKLLKARPLAPPSSDGGVDGLDARLEPGALSR